MVWHRMAGHTPLTTRTAPSGRDPAGRAPRRAALVVHDGHGDVVSVIYSVSNRLHFNNVHTYARVRAPLAVSPRRAQPPRLAPPSYLMQGSRAQKPVREPPATPAPCAGAPLPPENQSRHPDLDGWPLEVLSRLIARDPQDTILITPDHLAPDDLIDRLDDALENTAPPADRPAHRACVLHRCRSLTDLRARAEDGLPPDDRRHVLVVMDDDPVESGLPRAARATARDLGVPALIVLTARGWEELEDLGGAPLLLPGTASVDARPCPGSTEIMDYLRTAARRLEQYHEVTIPESTIAAAALADPPEGEQDQPRFGEGLLDLWACRGAILGRPRILPPQADDARPETTAPDVEQLFTALSATVLGQEEACRAVATQVALGASGLRLVRDRPRSALLLAGGTGTGKTLLARTLAEQVGRGPEPLIRVDMGSLTSDHLGSALLGSPPGYVGSTSRGGWLTTRIEASPHAVLLLDEVDKASPVLRDALLLELLGNGTLTDYSGRTVDASGLHVVLTANTGAEALTRTTTGFGDGHDRRHNAEAQVRRLLPPEVFNRLDALVLMAGLDRPRMAAVLDSVLADLSRVAGAAGYELEVGARVRERLLAEALTRPDGARRLQRTVEQALAAPLLGRPAGAYRAIVHDGAIAVGPGSAVSPGSAVDPRSAVSPPEDPSAPAKPSAPADPSASSAPAAPPAQTLARTRRRSTRRGRAAPRRRRRLAEE